MYFATFYHKNGLVTREKACGDRSVLILDGRCGRPKQHIVATDWAEYHGFAGYIIFKGTTINRDVVQLTPMMMV